MALIARMEWPEGHRLAFWLQEDELVSPSRADAYPFTEADWNELERYQHEKRRKEWFASRMALRSGLASAAEVRYLPNGKPYLDESALSFSHCLPLAGALTHPHLAGMDIQSCDPKIERIRERFANQAELEAAERSSSPIDYLTILWSAKEALFKVYGEELDFADGIHIRPFQVGDEALTALVHRKGSSTEHRLRAFQLMEHWVLVALS